MFCDAAHANRKGGQATTTAQDVRTAEGHRTEPITRLKADGEPSTTTASLQMRPTRARHACNAYTTETALWICKYMYTLFQKHGTELSQA